MIKTPWSAGRLHGFSNSEPAMSKVEHEEDMRADALEQLSLSVMLLMNREFDVCLAKPEATDIALKIMEHRDLNSEE